MVLVGQFFLQPLIAQKTLAREELWRSKLNAYVEAIEIVNQKFLSATWSGPDFSGKSYTTGEPPTSEKVNNAYAKLALLSDDPSVPHAYLACIEAYPSERPVGLNHRTKFITLCRKDLGTTDLNLDPKDIFIYFGPSK